MPPPIFETVYPKLNLSRFTRQVSAKTDNHCLKYATFSLRPTLGARASGGQRMKNGGKKMRRRMEEERGFSFVIPSPVLHPLTLCGSGTQGIFVHTVVSKFLALFFALSRIVFFCPNPSSPRPNPSCLRPNSR